MFLANQISKLLSILIGDKRERLFAYSTTQLGVKKSGIRASIDVGCVEAWMNIILECFGFLFSNTLSTTILDQELSRSIRVKKISILEVKRGDIIISPTRGKSIGHVGVLGDKGVIMSNNSRTGKWSDHLDISKWYVRYDKEYGLPVNFYRIVF